MDLLERTVNRNLLTYAVQKQIICPRSGEVLDVRTAVAVTFKHNGGESTVAMVGAEWDGIKDRIQVDAVKAGVEIELLDGRELFKR